MSDREALLREIDAQSDARAVGWGEEAPQVTGPRRKTPPAKIMFIGYQNDVNSRRLQWAFVDAAFDNYAEDLSGISNDWWRAYCGL